MKHEALYPPNHIINSIPNRYWRGAKWVVDNVGGRRWPSAHKPGRLDARLPIHFFSSSCPSRNGGGCSILSVLSPVQKFSTAVPSPGTPTWVVDDVGGPGTPASIWSVSRAVQKSSNSKLWWADGGGRPRRRDARAWLTMWDGADGRPKRWDARAWLPMADKTVRSCSESFVMNFALWAWRIDIGKS